MADSNAPTDADRPYRRQRRRLVDAFEREERAGLDLVLYARFVVLAVLVVWAVSTARTEYAVVYAGVLSVFAVLGALPLFLRRVGISGTKWMAVFFTLDVILLTYILMVPGSMFPSTLTPQFNLQLPNFLYLCLFVVGMAISYSPMLVLWTGVVAVIAWSVGMFWIAALPDSLTFSFSQLLDPARFTDDERIAITSSRLFVSTTHWYNRILFLCLVTLILTVAVWRSRRLVQRQIESEAARTNLARYFSPNMVDQLSSDSAELEATDTRHIAVLFVDIVGFTEVAERQGPHEVIALLREFHGRMARTVFNHGGTIDKYMGDAVMANFGTPKSGPRDASNALRCAFAMIDEVARWNTDRAADRRDTVEIGIGIHYGEVVTGNIGDEHRLEYAVLGDTVNVASRLERLTRDVGSRLVVSGELVSQVKAENDGADELLPAFTEDPNTSIRGRRQRISVWNLAAPYE